MLSQKELKKKYKYNKFTGIFTYRINTKHHKIGDICKTKLGEYIGIYINKNYYYAHRLAWLYVYGYFPENDIDHKDRIKYHNWIDNLRERTHGQNCRNKNKSARNKSNVTGVFWRKERSKWVASIGVNNTTKSLGYFEDFDEAVCHRLAAEQCLNWANCDDNSPAYKYLMEKILCKK